MKYLISTIFLLFSVVLLQGQILSGIVRTPQNAAVEAAFIQNLTNGTHTHSNENGTFVLDKINLGDEILVSHLGFEMVRITVQSLENKMVVVLKTKAVSLNEVVISPKLDALNMFSNINIQINPVNSSQEILRQVPGLFIGQHAGGGKAEQIFLRGFDIDHGTDIQLTVDGMPVNMVSHAHGQGYADLHFLIPETIEKIDFGKGPYKADKGNFATAGYVAFQTKDKLENNLIKLEAGQFNTQRILGMVNVLNQEKHTAYLATEFLSTDGPFESAQNFGRMNIMGKYSGFLANNDKIEVLASHFTSQWDASGQIPQRSVDAGTITRFGAIDDTEGGNTKRTNLLFSHVKSLDNRSYFKNSMYFVEYDFELYSNFTFFLNNPILGDQIKQKETRKIYGINSAYHRSFSAGRADGNLELGLSLRNDRSDNNELANTTNRTETLSRIQFGDIQETNMGIYANTEWQLGKWLFNPSLRLDYFDHKYNDLLLTAYKTQSNVKSIVSPKLNVFYNASEQIQYYLKVGRGFHSNDTRVLLAQDTRDILPAAYGADLGLIWKPTRNFLINAALWNLYLEQEFVYVGDAGIVEPSGRTNRRGVDLSLRYQPAKWIFGHLDANYTIGRAIGEPEEANLIPLAPDFSLTSGVTLTHTTGFYGTINVRHLGQRPANEDNSIVASGYTVVDANLGFQWKQMDIGFQIQNLLNTDWNETQFATESRLRNEPNPVEEIHFTPGTPFFLKGSVAYRF